MNRIFSFNLRGKGKKKTKKSESEPEGEEELDGNEAMEETSKKEERQETEAVEKNEKKHHQTAEEALKDETTQSEGEREGEEELDGNAAMKETLKEKERQEAKTAEKYDENKHHQTAKEALEDESLKMLKLKSVPDEDIVPRNHTNDDNNEAEHSKCSTDSKLESKKEIPSDSIINDAKIPYVDPVIQACVDSLIQTVEAGMSSRGLNIYQRGGEGRASHTSLAMLFLVMHSIAILCMDGRDGGLEALCFFSEEEYFFGRTIKAIDVHQSQYCRFPSLDFYNGLPVVQETSTRPCTFDLEFLMLIFLDLSPSHFQKYSAVLAMLFTDKSFEIYFYQCLFDRYFSRCCSQ